MKIVIIVLIALCDAKLCSDYYQDEIGCIQSTEIACRWSSNSNLCLESSGTQLGCLNILNLKACIAQTFYPDKSIAECVFSGYCRSVVYDSDVCSSNLSRAACLGVQSTFCLWGNNGCEILNDPTTINSNSTQASLIQQTSIAVCQLISGFPGTQSINLVIHQHGAHSALNKLYIANLMQAGAQSEFSTQMTIAGCFTPNEQVYNYISCEAEGLNAEGCIRVVNGLCKFTTSCKTVTDPSSLKCSDYLNKNACLAVTNISETCYWKNSQCSTYIVSGTTSCLIGIEVSPSVCANVTKEECFYHQSTQTCSSLCRTAHLISNASACLASSQGCLTDINQGCIFADGFQCDRLGQNKLACFNAKQYCKFVDGFCQSISNLNLLSCESGLNKLACINLTNPSQVCRFSTKCESIYITPQDQCYYLSGVNANACRKVTTAGCYWSNYGYCGTTSGDEQCTVSGLNKIGCLSTTNTLFPCHWNGSSGACETITISREDTCASIKMVNAVACRNITYSVNGVFQLCKHNSLTYSCEVFTMSNAIQCSTSGLNAIGCSSVSDPTLSCRWQGNQCANVQSLGNAVTCQALQLVTARTCAMIQSGTQKCKYDTTRQSCTTSVPPTSTCSESGLNPAGCASLTTSCYFDTTINQCKTASASEYALITCDANWPSKKACINITTNAQYCKWNSTSNLCEQQSFPVSNNCSKYTNVNKLFCLAYEISVTRYITASNYCTYDSATTSCKVYTSSSWVDCGVTQETNLHACVALSSTTKYCYFDTTTLKCAEILNISDNKFRSLTCKVGNYAVCLGTQTIQQYCAWNISQKKCYSIKSGGDCSDYTSGLETNSNLCSSTKSDTACQYDTINKRCQLATATNLSCTDQGLNEKACIENTNQACYFDTTNFKCLEVSGATAQMVSCSGSVNKLGCLASLKEPCYWDSGVCKQVTGITYDSVTCASLNDKLYNPIVCASVTTTDEYCAYDTGTYHCYSVGSYYISDCQSGYNQNTCAVNSNCQEWNSNTLLCATNVVVVTNPCVGKASIAQCLAVTTDNCAWIDNTCSQVQINEYYPSCDQMSSSQGKFSQRVCQSIIQSGEYCSWDSTTEACKPVTLNNNACNFDGLNYQACISKTQDHACQFVRDINSPNYGCSEISDFSDQGCSDTLNQQACITVTKNICVFQIDTQQCYEMEQYYVGYYLCSDFSDKSVQVVSSNFCTYVGGDDGCLYDSTNNVCKITNTFLPNCSSNTSINSGYCLNYIQSQTCYFDFFNGVCSVYDTTNSDCNICYSLKQCVTSAVSACQWADSTCSNITPQTDCTSLSNINALACMTFVNGNQKCQFKDLGTSTSCIIPSDDAQACNGLNKVACLANTANACYFYQKCIDITLQPYSATCTSDYSFTQAACIRIKTPSQLCKWESNSCVSMAVSNSDTCSTYSSNINSGLICASIKTGNCYWNNGCVSGFAPNCQTLGANQGACVGALSGNCMFSQNVCIDVSNPTPLISNNCSDPSNSGGCLNLNNGLPCSWSGSICDYITVTAGCATYTNVNPGVCGQTTDVACKWVTNACQAMTVKGSCTDKGLNKIACIGFTNGLCYYDNTKKQCYTIDDITKKECTDNINKNACLGHTSKCCKWETDTCVNATSGSSCSALTLNSNFCCLNLVGDKCTYTTSCAQLTIQTSKCYDASNITACMWIKTSCRWDSKQMQCLPVPKSFGCKLSINSTACVFQTAHCKFVSDMCMTASVDSDSCTSLAVSSNASTKCVLILNEKCQSSTNGCVIPADNSACSDTLNIFACLNNSNTCSWNIDTHKCTTVRIPSIQPLCPTTTYISRGSCSSSSQNCALDQSYTCKKISDLTSNTVDCDSRNAVPSRQSQQCTSLSSAICQYDPTNLKCTSTIFGAVCEVTITKLGCPYIQNNCYWQNNSCKTYDSTVEFYKCETIFSKFKCLKNVSTACDWDSNNHICYDYSGDMKACSEYTDDIISPGICYFYSTNFCAHNGSTCYLETAQTVCENSKSPLGCQANTSGNCYWDLYIGKCLTLIDTSLASSMTCPLFKYSNKQFCMAPIGEGQTCVWKDNLCQSADVQEVTCDSDLSLNGCRAVALLGQECIFSTKCDYSDNTITNCTDPINIYACLAVLKDGQYCKWLGQMCYSLSLEEEDGYLIGTHILVNANACRKTYTMKGIPDDKLAHIGVKYDSINYVCQPSESQSDLCSTPGLNYYGCLSTKADTCDWNGSKCVSFNFNVNYTTCEEYNTVSPKVCASINQGKVMCQHNSNTLSCEDFTEDQYIFVGDQYTNSKQGMNRLACINVKRQPTVWTNGECYYNQVKPAITTCGQLVDVNANSCAQVDKEDIICKYDSDGKCTTLFDGTIDKCITAGLNKLGCIQVENVQCQYINGQCQYFDFPGNYDCSSLTNVNAPVCSKVPHQPCKFSYINRGCIDVYSHDKCGATSINQLGCNQQQKCQWIDSKCYCKAQLETLGIIDCSKFAINQCILSQCIVDDEKCRNRVCSDFSAAQCNGATAGKVQCYLNKLFCTSAQKCNDLFNVTCSQFQFNGVICETDPWNSNHCVSKSCSTLTTQDVCSGNCTWSSSSGCVIKECIYMKKDQCSGIMNAKQCFWDGTYCQPLSTCQDFMSYQTTQTQAICEAQSILNNQCYWKLIKPYGSDYQCTSSLCYDKGSSQISCHGTEVGNEVCILQPDYSCVPCSEIKEACDCLAYSYCYYIESKGCQSNSCNSLDQESCGIIQVKLVNNSARCTYINGSCKQVCGKLSQSDCTKREGYSECHWNSDQSKCLIGAAPVISINTLAEVIVIESLWSLILSIAYFILLI